MKRPPTQLVCSGCGHIVPAGERHPFRCPKRRDGDDTDHVLRELLPPQLPGLREAFESEETNPFLKFRNFFHAYHTAIAWGLSDADFVAIVRRLDDSVKEVDGRGFTETPFESSAGLAEEIGTRELWVKDETGNVSGSHKARHTMGIMIWLEIVRKAFPDSAPEPRLAISSCGNAALAAAVVAKAAGRCLDVFVPPDAHPNIVRKLGELGARLVRCPREAAQSGDPCYLRFREAVRDGALPFTVQGNENALTVFGGKTLAYEMVARLRREQRTLDRLFIHVGGGALASAVIQGLTDLSRIGLLDRVPVIHAVQTGGAYPLARAHEKLAKRVAARYPDRETNHVPTQVLEEELWFAALHRSSFMWPWESEPKSIAHGILDDETYDWLAVVEGMLRTGGSPVVVSEEHLREANRLAMEKTTVRADPTGTAGLAGLLNLRTTDTAAVLFTGSIR